MKTLRSLLLGAIALGAAALFVNDAVKHANAVIPVPGVSGPFLGDQNANIFSIVQALTLLNQSGFNSAITSGVANAQATCFQLVNPLNQITTNVATGSVCLPPALPGRIVWITNTTANQVNLFGANAPAVVGTQDTINGTTGSTANTTVLPAAAANKTTTCIAAATGAWNCTVAA